MKKLAVALCLLGTGAVVADDANIAWQFTGATSRSPAASQTTSVADYVAPPKVFTFDVSYFDSLLPGCLTLPGLNLNSLSVGLLLILR